MSYDFQTFQIPGAYVTEVLGTNDRGDIVGGIVAPDTMATSPYVRVAGIITPIDIPGTYYAIASDINNSGEVVGYYRDPSSGWHRGFIYNAGTVTPYNVPGAIDTVLYGTNDSGQLVGTYIASGLIHGFIDTGGTIQTLDLTLTSPTLISPGQVGTFAEGINNHGDVVGYYFLQGVEHGFTYSAGMYANLDVAGAVGTGATRINDSSTVVGFYRFGDTNSPDYGFSAIGGVATAIDTPTGFMDVVPLDINNAGQIVGNVGIKGFIATPVPLPPGALLFPLAFAALRLVRRRQ